MNRIPLLALLGLSVITAGCSNQDFGHMRVPDTTIVPDQGNDPEILAIEQQDRERMLNELQRWRLHTASVNQVYQLGPEDRLRVEVLSLERPGETTVIERSVASDGTVSLPLVGKVPLAGSSTGDAETRITGAYDGRFIRNAQTSVEIIEHRSVNVVISGSVSSPGHYNLKNNSIPLIEMLALAGGVSEDAGRDIFVTRELSVEDEDGTMVKRPELLKLDRIALTESAISEMNIPIIDNDVITIPSRNDEVIYVLGYVNRPGAFPLRRSSSVDAMRAVALAGGLSASARAENSYMIRRTGEGQMIRPLNLKKIAGGDEAPIYLQPGDTLVVGTSMIAKLSEFVKPSVSAGYDLSPVP